MPVPITIHRQRVQRHQLIARRDQRPDHQTPVGLDPDHHRRLIVVGIDTLTDECMDPG